MATGLLVVATGRATRLIRFVQDLPKEYLARVMFGVATDTLDADGAVLWREPMPFAEAELEAVLPRFVGAVLQVPPMVSAVRVGGRRLHELHRAGRPWTGSRAPSRSSGSRSRSSPRATTPKRCSRSVAARGPMCGCWPTTSPPHWGEGPPLWVAPDRGGLDRADGDAVLLDDLVNAIEMARKYSVRSMPGCAISRGDGRRGDGVGSPWCQLRIRARCALVGTVRVYDGDGRLIAVYRVEGRLAVPEVVLDAGSAE